MSDRKKISPEKELVLLYKQNGKCANHPSFGGTAVPEYKCPLYRRRNKWLAKEEYNITNHLYSSFVNHLFRRLYMVGKRRILY